MRRRPGFTVPSGVDRLVEVMDRLRSPGGCAWDAEQTHASLARHAIEEAHELVEAIETGSRADLREELGDVLLQVVFHARLAQEDAAEPFDLDAIANSVADKLVERHPHVFSDAPAPEPADRHATWERIKRASTSRASTFDGIPVDLPALQRAQKVIARGSRAGLRAGDDAGVDIGRRILALVAEAEACGVDAEGALRDATRGLEGALRRAEALAGAAAEGTPEA